MICALPNKRFRKRWTQIITKYGFLAFPHFLDNDYVKDMKASIKWLEENLLSSGYGLIRFAVAPDYLYDEMNRLKNEWSDINWIFPFHSKTEDFSSFEWVGFPYRTEFRDYDLQYFLESTKDKKRWYLGFWTESNPKELLFFNGFDTTIPTTYARVYGKLWMDWQKSEKAPHMFFDELFEFNVLSFKIALLKLFSLDNSNDLQLELEEYVKH